MRAEQYIDDLLAHGQHHFTTGAAVSALGGSPAAARAQLRRLKSRRRIASPVRSFHVIVPPEYRRLGCVPAEHFIDQLMTGLELPYYISLLSAAEHHGAAHQRPQALQVMVPRNRPPVHCGAVRIAFVARADLDRMPVERINTPRGYLRYATPEVTALELAGYPRHAGGLSNVATVLEELAEVLDPSRLLDAARLSPVGWAQRLGYLLELCGAHEPSEALAPFVDAEANSYTPLRRAEPVAGASRSARWKVIVNEQVEPDS